MPLEPIPELMAHARRHGYAVGYFEAWDLASLEGVVDAAERSRAPIIVGFNGEFLARSHGDGPRRLRWYGALGRAAAETAKVPCGVIFNECPQDDWVLRATESGFNLVMLADPSAEYADLVRRIAAVAGVAHQRGVAVEGELGQLPSGAEGEVAGEGSPTDPDLAASFVAQTGIDLLAVSVGNVHVLVRGRRELDLDRLAAVRHKVEAALVLHGGSGIAPRWLQKAVALGVSKVNFGTYLKQRFLAAIRAGLERAGLDRAGTNPHHSLGYGGEDDLVAIGRRAAGDAVLERIGLLGCCGKA